MTWVFFGVRMLLALATVGVGVAVVRPAHARAGMMLAAAGGLELLSACLVRGLMVALRSTDAELGPAVQLIGVVGTLTHVLYAGLVIAALVALARELVLRRAGAGQRAPLQF
jgi:hypothetical protein